MTINGESITRPYTEHTFAIALKMDLIFKKTEVKPK